MGDHDHDHGVGQPHDDDHDHDDGGHDHGDEHAHGGGHGHDHGHDAGHDHDHGHGSGHDHGHEHGGIRGLIAGVFSPHSDAADSVDAALTASADGLRALKISLAGLAVTAVLQAVIFALSGSVALLGDTIHNFADALTAVPLGIAFLVGRRPANERYTYGYGRAEDLAGIFVVAMIALSSALAAWEAIRRLMHPATVHNLVWVMAGG